jgi:hypothetical protein
MLEVCAVSDKYHLLHYDVGEDIHKSRSISTA